MKAELNYLKPSVMSPNFLLTIPQRFFLPYQGGVGRLGLKALATYANADRRKKRAALPPLPKGFGETWRARWHETSWWRSLYAPGPSGPCCEKQPCQAIHGTLVLLKLFRGYHTRRLKRASASRIGARQLVGTLAVVALVLVLQPSVRAQGTVKAVLFDSYGTLVSWEGVEDAVAEVFQRKGVDADPGVFTQLWRSKQLVYIMYNTLVDKGFEPFSFVTRRALHTAARFNDVRLTQPEEDELIQAWHELDPYPDVIEGLKAIRALGYPIMGPLTNGDNEMVRIGIVDRFAEMGFEFDVYLTADLWGKNKVHPDIYLKSIAKLGLDLDEVVYVCRGQFDIVGAKAAGLRVIWVNRAAEPLEDHGYTPDWEARDFFEVAEILERERL